MYSRGALKLAKQLHNVIKTRTTQEDILMKPLETVRGADIAILSYANSCTPNNFYIK